MDISSQEQISHFEDHKEHGNAPAGADPVPVQWAVFERLGPRCLIVRAEPSGEQSRARGRQRAVGPSLRGNG